jgi:hypothetical protein
MESIQTQLNEVNVNLWLSRFAIASDFALAIVCAAFLCLIAYYSVGRRDMEVPTIVWCLAIYLAGSGLSHLAKVVLDQSPTGWPGYLQIFVAVMAWILFLATLKLAPTFGHFGVLARQNQNLQRDVDQLRVNESTFQQRVSELERINAELEYVSRGVVGREERILELKREINQLLQRVGEQPRYRAAMDLTV